MGAVCFDSAGVQMQLIKAGSMAKCRPGLPFVGRLDSSEVLDSMLRMVREAPALTDKRDLEASSDLMQLVLLVHFMCTGPDVKGVAAWA